MEDKIIQLAMTKKPSKESFNAYKKASRAYNEALSQVALTKFNLEEAEEKLLQSIFSQITDAERRGILFDLGYHLPRDKRL